MRDVSENLFVDCAAPRQCLKDSRVSCLACAILAEQDGEVRIRLDDVTCTECVDSSDVGQ